MPRPTSNDPTRFHSARRCVGRSQADRHHPDAQRPSLRPGQLRPLSTRYPWDSVCSTILTDLFALLTLAVARSRAKALAVLGVSALLVGGAGWAGLEVARRYVNDALNEMTGAIRQVADVMVSHAEQCACG